MRVGTILRPRVGSVLRCGPTLWRRATRNPITNPTIPPTPAITSASSARAVKPSGGAAAWISLGMPSALTSAESFSGGTTRLPMPSSAANHSATMAGNSRCAVTAAVVCGRFGWLVGGMLTSF